MPLIDYKCKKCGENFFEIVKNDKDRVFCPKCGSEEAERVYKGKYYGKNGGGCSGNCSGCAGCH
ncbi:zinc ribbon domain-containing protein [Clostridium sp. 19966]|uniref:FmdB family zinc ribbon protein n=1 Tax=Clostridium sp. 19966 TaxID=2768166 RepID=UPI0028DEE8F9|nr:FmdB family zinc ribbon protein [Clostridium sp. 19966]MDT8718676.1 zinc ribbon domain-containing protein [Clostridium sp. 19966]